MDLYLLVLNFSFIQNFKLQIQYTIYFLFFILFNDGHVLQLRSEIVVIHRLMRNGLDDYDGQMISGDKYGLNFPTFILQLRENPRKNLNQEIHPSGI